MDKLVEDDVIVADLLGKKVGGAFIGDDAAPEFDDDNDIPHHERVRREMGLDVSVTSF